MCFCMPILRWSLQFLVRVFTFLSLILWYSYFGTFLSTWSVSLVIVCFIVVNYFQTSGSLEDDGRCNPVQKVLTKILNLCERFCAVASDWTGDFNDTLLKQLDEIVKEYECLSMYLLRLLTDLSVHSCGSHLAQLLLRLDFNRWFTEHTNITSP